MGPLKSKEVSIENAHFPTHVQPVFDFCPKCPGFLSNAEVCSRMVPIWYEIPGALRTRFPDQNFRNDKVLVGKARESRECGNIKRDRVMAMGICLMI